MIGIGVNFAIDLRLILSFGSQFQYSIDVLHKTGVPKPS